MADQPVLLDRKPAETGTLPRVLAADDQPQILEALSLLLQPAGFHVDCRVSGRRTSGAPQPVLRCTVDGSELHP